VSDIVDEIGRFAGRTPLIGPAADWIARAAASGVVGFLVGSLIVVAHHRLRKHH
jgi:uncharacterized protein